MVCARRPVLRFDVPSTRRPLSIRVASVVTRREEAIELALKAKLEQRRRARAGAVGESRGDEPSRPSSSTPPACFLIDRTTRARSRRGDRPFGVDGQVVKHSLERGEPNLQFLLVPARLEASRDALDTSKDGELDMDERAGTASCARAASLSPIARRCSRGPWAVVAEKCNYGETHGLTRTGEEAISAASRSVSQLQDEQERLWPRPPRTRPSRPSLGAARRVFAMIDDNSGTLTKEEIKRSVKSDKEVIDFPDDRGEENLQFLLEPKRLDRALNAWTRRRTARSTSTSGRGRQDPGRHRCDC